jgi:arylsulfatase
VKADPRPGFLYFSDDGDLMALRYGNWKIHFAVQRAHGFHSWGEPLVQLRVPQIVNLRSNPFELDDEDANIYGNKWFIDRVFLLVPAQVLVGMFLKSFEAFPPRQRPSSFNLGDALEKARQKHDLLASASGGGVK